MPDLGWEELSIIVVSAIILFGAVKLSAIGSAGGKGIRESKRAATGSRSTWPTFERTTSSCERDATPGIDAPADEH
jgi:Sec-independent protein translocase protein TatA